MVDAGAIGGAIASMKVAMDISRAMLELRDFQMVQNHAIDLNRRILEAQGLAMEARAEIDEMQRTITTLEAEAMRLKDWAAERENYVLAPVGHRGVFVYTLKDGVDPAQPPHSLCPNCFTQWQKSILQPETRNPGRNRFLVCPRCRTELITEGDRSS